MANRFIANSAAGQRREVVLQALRKEGAPTYPYWLALQTRMSQRLVEQALRELVRMKLVRNCGRIKLPFAEPYFEAIKGQ